MVGSAVVMALVSARGAPGIEDAPRRSLTAAELRSVEVARKRELEEALGLEQKDDDRTLAAGGLVRVKRTGEQWSGECASWSPWHRIEADPPPAGYVQGSATFRLVGGRVCGDGAECELAARAPISFRYRLKGAEESFEGTWYGGYQAGQVSVKYTVKGGATTSTGILKVRYLPEPPGAGPPRSAPGSP